MHLNQEMMQATAEDLADVFKKVDTAARKKQIYTPEDIRSSVPAAYFSEQTRKNMEKQRLSCGADELAERVAMLDIDGSEAIQFMSCVRYGDRWYNRTPMSILAMIAGTETYSGGLVWQ